MNDTFDQKDDDSAVATATRHSARIRGAQFDPGHGTGTWGHLWITIMTLTYRGQKYEQNKQAAPQPHPALLYRSVTYKK